MDRPLSHNRRHLLGLSLGVTALWAAFATLGVLQYVIHLGAPLGQAIRTNASFAISWALVTPWIVAAAAALTKPRSLWSRALLVVALLVVPWVALFLRDLLTGHDSLRELREDPIGFLGGVYENVFFAVFIVLVTVSAHAARRNARRRREEAEQRRELTRVQLDALRSSVEPHFLFNALNSVAALIVSDAREAKHVLRQLSELLHTPVFQQEEVPLHEEVAFAARYLEIQKTRFRDRLTVHVEIAPDAGEMLVPSLILQPLVENAITHGIAGTGGVGRLEVRAETNVRQVLLTVRDTGTGFEGEGCNANGIGLSSVRKRLDLLFGADHSLTLAREQTGFSVQVAFPAKRIVA